MSRAISRDITAQFEEATPRPTHKAVRKTAGKDRVGMTFYMSPATHKRMKDIASERQTALQQLVAEAVDEWLARQGEPAYEYKSIKA